MSEGVSTRLYERVNRQYRPKCNILYGCCKQSDCTCVSVYGHVISRHGFIGRPQAANTDKFLPARGLQRGSDYISTTATSKTPLTAYKQTWVLIHYSNRRIKIFWTLILVTYILIILGATNSNFLAMCLC